MFDTHYSNDLFYRMSWPDGGDSQTMRTNLNSVVEEAGMTDRFSSTSEGRVSIGRTRGDWGCFQGPTGFILDTNRRLQYYSMVFQLLSMVFNLIQSFQ
jgi:hypothetical protein